MKLIDRAAQGRPARHPPRDHAESSASLLTVLLAFVWLIPFLWMGVATLRPASDGII